MSSKANYYDVKANIVRVNRYKGEIKSLSYELTYKTILNERVSLKGRIKIDKSYIYTGLFNKWHRLSWDSETNEFGFPDPVDKHSKPYRIFQELIDVVDMFIIEDYLLG
jgi:hypothetical protein